MQLPTDSRPRCSATGSFNRSGDFTVWVEERSEPEHGEARKSKFLVWSFVLSAWSDVLETMVSQNFLEGIRGEVVIRDFSARAVGAFLRFLYAGVVEEESLVAVVEVAAIADKYGVSKLCFLCEDHVVKSLSPEDACEFLALADRYSLDDLRQSCLDHILVAPKKALRSWPSIEASLLQEVLTSSLLCLDDKELFELFLAWGADSGLGPVVPLIEQHVHASHILRRDALVLVEKVRALQDPAGERLVSILMQADCTTSSADLLNFLFRVSRDTDEFQGCRVNVGVSRRGLIPSSGVLTPARGRLEGYVRAGDWIAWTLPNDEVFLSGFSFAANISCADHVLVYAAQETSGWTLVLDTKAHGCIPPRTKISCRCTRAVQRLKLQVIATAKGEGVRLGKLEVHGAFAPSSPATSGLPHTISDSEEEAYYVDPFHQHAAPEARDLSSGEESVEMDFDLFG